MSRPDVPLQMDPAEQSARDLNLMSEVVRAMLLRMGGELVLTGDDLFVGRQCSLAAASLVDGAIALRIVMPTIIPPGPQVIIP